MLNYFSIYPAKSHLFSFLFCHPERSEGSFAEILYCVQNDNLRFVLGSGLPRLTAAERLFLFS